MDRKEYMRKYYLENKDKFKKKIKKKKKYIKKSNMVAMNIN